MPAKRHAIYAQLIWLSLIAFAPLGSSPHVPQAQAEDLCHVALSSICEIRGTDFSLC